MELPRQRAQMDGEELRDLTATLIARLNERDRDLADGDAQLASRDEELKGRQLKIDQLTHEMAMLKRWGYERHSEQLDPVQRSLLDESIDADIEAVSLELEPLIEKPAREPKSKPRRVALPRSFPRREIRHEPEHTECSCSCNLERIGEDISEKLDYTPGVVRGRARHPRKVGLSRLLLAAHPGARGAAHSLTRESRPRACWRRC